MAAGGVGMAEPGCAVPSRGSLDPSHAMSGWIGSDEEPGAGADGCGESDLELLAELECLEVVADDRLAPGREVLQGERLE